MQLKHSLFLRTKKHLFNYTFERLWLVLTVFSLISVYFIIRGSSVPLINENEHLYKWFYTKPNGDKTVYNISISYFAAYIFYLITVDLKELSQTVEQIKSNYNMIIENYSF